MRPYRRITLAVLLAILLLPSSSGCLLLVAGAGAGAGATWYLSAAREEVDADPRRVVEVAAEVLGEMHITVESRQATELDGRVVGRTAGDDRVEVKVSSPAKDRSAIDVRVGILDDDSAKRILDRILAKL
jgi:hypothetical protein